MKLLIAIIRENQLDQVREALVNAGISRITVSNVSGHGRTQTEEIYRGQKVVPTLVPNVRVEIALNDAFVKPACDAILTATQANDGGFIGSGKIFVVPLEECIRLRTGEHGSEAI
ncbi:MAG TPA: P-II family nitrogen regulator [Cyclobacteriaceae bacterium]|nr:P-II family nitrogen regulator [Cyclobacteriaceae bacterium]